MLWLLFSITIYLQCVCSELFAVKGAGNVGYYDANNKWNLLYENKKAVQVSSSKSGIWIINKFNSVLKKNIDLNNDKWISMRKSFVSLTTNHINSIFGVTDKGQIYQCLKDCNEPKKWEKFISPKMSGINDEDHNIGSEIREKLKMKPLLHGKLTQLTTFNDLFYGKDEIGNLWNFIVDRNEWIKIETQFLLKWIDITDGNILYAINDEDNKPYKIDLKWNKYDLIHNANDFEQIIYNNDKNLIYGLNYYQQIFYLDEDKKDWIYIDDNIHFIQIGQLPQLNNIKNDL